MSPLDEVSARRLNQSKKRKRRLVLGLLLALVFNGSLLYLFFSRSSPIPNLEELGLKSDTLIPEGPLWLLEFDRLRLKREILATNPLVTDLELKAVLFPGEPRLQVSYQKDKALARFSNGWILTGKGKILKDKNHQFLPEASIQCSKTECQDWQDRGKELLELVSVANASSPEKLIAVHLVEGTVFLEFETFRVSLGFYDKNGPKRLKNLAKLKDRLDWNKITEIELYSGSKGRIVAQ